jgi:hypothetical protein
MSIATHENPEAAASETVSENSTEVMKNSGGLNQIVLQFLIKSAIFPVLHRASQVALLLCLPAQRAPGA